MATSALIIAIILFGAIVYLERQVAIKCEKRILEENSSRLEQIYEDTKKVYKRKNDFNNLDVSIDLEWLRKQRLGS